MSTNQEKILNFKVEEMETGARLDVFLKSKIVEVSREKIKRVILAGKAQVAGQGISDPSRILKAGEEVSIAIDTTPFTLQPESLTLKKIYEDEDFLVIDKPAGLVMHPGANIASGTLANALLGEYPSMAGIGDAFRPGIIHRLDKETSGLILLAKTPAAFEYGKALFKKREIIKEYETLVVGQIESQSGFIEKPLLLVPERRRVEVSDQGRQALTEYKVMGFYTDGVDFYTLVRVILHTGRTHQIRVHFSSLGHPVVGDSTYGPRQPFPPGLTRQFLHAKRLMFKLPSGTTLDLESPLPEDLKTALDSLKLVIKD